MGSPEGLFTALVAANPSQPFVTYYDDATGERSELSARSLANWVAKTHYLLGDSLGLGPGDAAYVRLPAHWISVPVLLGCWTAGLEVITADVDRAMVAFAAPDLLDEVRAVPDVFAIAPDSAAVGFRGDPPDGAEDYVVAVRPQADAWAGVRPPASPADPAIDGQSRADVAATAAVRAAELGLARGTRAITGRSWNGPADWLDTLLAPLAVAGSIVIVGNAEPGTIGRRADQERATVVI